MRQGFLKLFLVLLVIDTALAQTVPRDEAYLTKPVREAIGKLMAEQFLKIAPEVGFNASESGIVAQGMRDGSLVFNAGGGFGVIQTPSGSVQIRDSNQVSTFQRIYSGSMYASLVERYATVRLNVVPVPPRDYKVLINGEDCPATERAVYRVMAGPVAVEIIREGKPHCAWSGSIGSGKEHSVLCQF